MSKEDLTKGTWILEDDLVKENLKLPFLSCSPLEEKKLMKAIRKSLMSLRESKKKN